MRAEVKCPACRAPVTLTLDTQAGDGTFACRNCRSHSSIRWEKVPAGIKVDTTLHYDGRYGS
jgi:transcription elongation factor Elf1